MCQVLNVNRSGYYAWRSHPDSARALDNAVLLGKVKQFFAASGNIYGSPRIYRDCKAAGLTCIKNRVAKLMHQAKVHAIRIMQPAVNSLMLKPFALISATMLGAPARAL